MQRPLLVTERSGRKSAVPALLGDAAASTKNPGAPTPRAISKAPSAPKLIPLPPQKYKRDALPRRCSAGQMRNERRSGPRLTVSASYRPRLEVLLADTGPLPNLLAVREALSEIDAALDTHSDLLFGRGAELVVRVAERRFERPDKPTPRPQRRASGIVF